MKWPHIFAIVIFVMLIPVVAVVLKNEEKQKKVNAQKAAMAAAQAQLEREAVTREKFDKIRQDMMITQVCGIMGSEPTSGGYNVRMQTGNSIVFGTYRVVPGEDLEFSAGQGTRGQIWGYTDFTWDDGENKAVMTFKGKVDYGASTGREMQLSIPWSAWKVQGGKFNNQPLADFP